MFGIKMTIPPYPAGSFPQKLVNYPWKVKFLDPFTGRAKDSS